MVWEGEGEREGHLQEPEEEGEQEVSHHHLHLLNLPDEVEWEGLAHWMIVGDCHPLSGLGGHLHQMDVHTQTCWRS